MISILMPVYNTEKEDLIKSIESCLAQTINNYEIVIVDNGSDKEETIQVLDKYKSVDKIKVINCERKEEHKNFSLALNHGLKNCNYDLVARMDSDDVMVSTRLEKQYSYFLSNPDVDILGGQIIINNSNVTNHPHIVTKQIGAYSGWFLNHPTVMYKKQKIINVGGYRSKPIHIAEDYELWLRCLTNNFVIHNLPDVVVYYKYHDLNLTNKTQKMDNYYQYLKQVGEEYRIQNDIK